MATISIKLADGPVESVERVFINGNPVRISVMDPDGVIHGAAPIVAAADAYKHRPQDLAPIARAIVFGRRP